MFFNTSRFLSVFAVLLGAVYYANASSVGSSIVSNYCDFPIYVWVVDDTSVSNRYDLQNGDSFCEEYDGAGVALKVSNQTDALANGLPMTIFAYSLDKASNKVWYDLSGVNGDAFSGHRVALQPNSSQCAGTVWPNGTKENPMAGVVCPAQNDLVLSVC